MHPVGQPHRRRRDSCAGRARGAGRPAVAREDTGLPGAADLRGRRAYISPSRYPAKAEHGRVRPTWNYSAVHLTGTV
ncbi:FMN-binding negative transcriptional regulator [Mycobacterium sp. B14F4]|uniref:FMN-binding negative transcriptional regulator n=1 Tax=Mycobacterium sp. B14F4 TaxID=3153565 RepID=UPI00325D427F